jgi:6-phosphogluconate dehydrogenase (decarboxylating)
MELAMIGLGKMGSNMARRLLRGGHRVIAYDLNEEAIQAAEAEGAEGARTLEEVGSKLRSFRSSILSRPELRPEPVEGQSGGHIEGCYLLQFC